VKMNENVQRLAKVDMRAGTGGFLTTDGRPIYTDGEAFGDLGQAGGDVGRSASLPKVEIGSALEVRGPSRRSRAALFPWGLEDGRVSEADQEGTTLFPPFEIVNTADPLSVPPVAVVRPLSIVI
jgi:hypothetical protein